MHDLALYRKYRPQKWEQIFGQDHITSILEQSVKSNKVSHAYLFVGSRGTGKTSVARIFAEDIGVSPNDLYEIDAASNRGIDDIRALRDGVRVLPFDSKYKVYIIDEVHMLSKDAWGALLKTLEEPPKHVIFILATTELQKVPETIISRCQVFTFKKASELMLKNIISYVAGEEGYELLKDATELLALLGDGSYRDGLGELQKVLNFWGADKENIKKNKNHKIQISREDVEKITGAPKTALVNDFIAAIAEKNLEKGIIAVRIASGLNLDMKLYFKLILTKFRTAMILKYAPRLLDTMSADLGENDVGFLKSLIKDKGGEMLNSKNLSILLDQYKNLNNAFIAELPLELALVKIIGQDDVV